MPVLIRDQMLKRGAVRRPRRKIIQVPELGKKCRQAGMRVLPSSVGALVLDDTFSNPRAYEQCRHSDA